MMVCFLFWEVTGETAVHVLTELFHIVVLCVSTVDLFVDRELCV